MRWQLWAVAVLDHDRAARRREAGRAPVHRSSPLAVANADARRREAVGLGHAPSSTDSRMGGLAPGFIGNRGFAAYTPTLVEGLAGCCRPAALTLAGVRRTLAGPERPDGCGPAPGLASSSLPPPSPDPCPWALRFLPWSCRPCTTAALPVAEQAGRRGPAHGRPRSFTWLPDPGAGPRSQQRHHLVTLGPRTRG